MPDDKNVFLLLANEGATAHEISFELEGAAVSFAPVVLDSGFRALAIYYQFVPMLRGKDQSMKVAFLATNGVRDEHTYATRHGYRVFDRANPD